MSTTNLRLPQFKNVESLVKTRTLNAGTSGLDTKEKPSKISIIKSAILPFYQKNHQTDGYFEYFGICYS